MAADTQIDRLMTLAQLAGWPSVAVVVTPLPHGMPYGADLRDAREGDFGEFRASAAGQTPSEALQSLESHLRAQLLMKAGELEAEALDRSTRAGVIMSALSRMR